MAVDGAARHSWDVPLSFVNSSFFRVSLPSSCSTLEPEKNADPFCFLCAQKQFTSQLLGSVVRFSVTAAIILLYMRLFSVLKWIPVLCYCLFVFTFLIQVENISVALYWYIPRPSDASHIVSQLQRTKDTAASAIANAAATTALDIILFLVPFIIVPSLNMSREKRRACYLVFFFGILLANPWLSKIQCELLTLAKDYCS